MKVIRCIALGVLAATLASCGVAAAADELDSAPAMTAAQDWLALVDRGNYGASWDAAAELFREKVERAKWETMVESIRAPLGGVISRKVRIASVMRDVPGAPAGEYVVIQYDTRYENRPLTTEVVTPMRDKDGAWRVSGYYIR